MGADFGAPVRGVNIVSAFHAALKRCSTPDQVPDLKYGRMVEKVPRRLDSGVLLRARRAWTPVLHKRGVCLGSQDFSQFPAQDLAGWGSGQRFHEMDLPRPLVGSETLGDKSAKVIF